MTRTADIQQWAWDEAVQGVIGHPVNAAFFENRPEWIESVSRVARALLAAYERGRGERKLTVFDWAYDDNGDQLYARTPERAHRLAKRGVKLTPVYTIEAT